MGIECGGCSNQYYPLGKNSTASQCQCVVENGVDKCIISPLIEYDPFDFGGTADHVWADFLNCALDPGTVAPDGTACSLGQITSLFSASSYGGLQTQTCLYYKCYPQFEAFAASALWMNDKVQP